MEILKQMDAAILLWIQDNMRFSAATPFWKCITFLGNGGWFWILTSIFLICRKKQRAVGAIALASIFSGFLITNLALKNIIARPRPFDEISAVIPLITKPTDFSFPSGHTCVSFVTSFVYYRMMPKKYGISALLLASLIAFSRLYLGVHYPSDIAGGIAVAFICSMTFTEMWKRRQKRNQQTIQERRRDYGSNGNYPRLSAGTDS